MVVPSTLVGFARRRARGYGRRVETGPQQRGRRNTRRRLWLWVLLSFLLHLPFSPLGPILGLMSWSSRFRDVPNEPVEALVGIPIELLTDDSAPSQPVAPPVSKSDPALTDPEGPTPSKPKKPVDAGVDSGVDAGSDGGPDAGLDASLDAGEDAGEDAAVDAGPSKDAGDAGDGGALAAPVASATPPEKDPFAVTGDFAQVAKSNTNVKLHLWTKPLRTHPLGADIAQLLANEPQWKSFLGDGAINPLTDLDTIVLYGPQLVDSSQVGAFVAFNTEPKKVRAAVDAIVARDPKGTPWKDEKKKPVARARADRADRVFVLFPNKTLAIVPPGGADAAVAVKRIALPESDSERTVLHAYLKTPHRVKALERYGFTIPTSIASAQVTVSTTVEGGASLELRLEDASPDDATAHRPELEKQLTGLTGGLVQVTWQQSGKRLTAKLELSPFMLRMLWTKEIAPQLKRGRR